MPGPVGDAVVQVADAGDVLLVVGAGRADELRLAPEHRPDRRRHRLRHRQAGVGQHGRTSIRSRTP